MPEHDPQAYGGRRILEVMHGAVRYGDAIFSDVSTAMPPQAGKILDFGAGDGFFVDRFRARGVAVDCVEPDPQLLARLRPRAGNVYSDSAEIAAGSYDFAYAVNVLEHIAEIDRACAELSRVLTPAGRLFVFVPAFEVLWTSLDDEVGHVRRFSRPSLRAALQNAGFVVERLRFFNSLGFGAALGVRLLENVGLFRYDSGKVGLYDRFLFPVSRRLDGVLHGVLGKNLVAVAGKAVPGSSGP